MVGTTTPHQIVIFTHQHSISGEIFLRDQRLSDFLNDRREKKVVLHNASVARLESPSKVLEKTLVSSSQNRGLCWSLSRPRKWPPLRVSSSIPKIGTLFFLSWMGWKYAARYTCRAPWTCYRSWLIRAIPSCHSPRPPWQSRPIPTSCFGRRPCWSIPSASALSAKWSRKPLPSRNNNFPLEIKHAHSSHY